MFKCERCGSRYSAMHAATIENCPRCLIRDRTIAPLVFTAFEQSVDAESEDPDPGGRYIASAARSSSSSLR
jgi:predicted  nucleic acid-binding Zn-ribbon protein